MHLSPLLPLLPSSEERKRKCNDVVASIKRRLERSKTKETKSSVVIQNPERHARIRPSPSPSCLAPHLRSSWPSKGEEGESSTPFVQGGMCMSLPGDGDGDRRRWPRRRCAGRLEEGEGVNDPDSRDRTCVSPRTTDYEWATLWRSRSTELMHVKGGCGQKERRGEDARARVCARVWSIASTSVEESIALGAFQSEGVSYTDAVYAATIVYHPR